MSAEPQLRTQRLLLRRWRDADLGPFAALNADAVVMKYFPATLTAEQSAALMQRIERCFDERGYGLWAVEIPGEVELAGFVGLAPVDIDVAFAPAVEVGWRLGRESWGRGIATEAAAAATEFGLGRLGLAGLVSYTALANTRSRAVMERLGMQHDPAEDFDHPQLPTGHSLSRHVLYRTPAQARR